MASNTVLTGSIAESLSLPAMPDLILTDLRHFLLLAEELHFGRTAERIGVAQPVLSRRIRRLEQAVGNPLFERSSRSVALTRAGRQLRDQGGKALLTLDNAVRAAGQTARRDTAPLRIGFITAAEPVLRSLLDRCRTHLRCDVQLFQLSSAQQVDQLRSGAVDIGLLRPPASCGNLHIVVLGREGVVCAMPQGHRLAGVSELRLEAVAGERLIRFGPVIGTLFQRRIDQELRRRRIAVVSGGSAQDTYSIQVQVASAAGIALLPAYVALTPWPGVAYAAIADLPEFIPLAAATRANETRRMVLRAAEMVVAGSR